MTIEIGTAIVAASGVGAVKSSTSSVLVAGALVVVDVAVVAGGGGGRVALEGVGTMARGSRAVDALRDAAAAAAVPGGSVVVKSHVSCEFRSCASVARPVMRRRR